MQSRSRRIAVAISVALGTASIGLQADIELDPGAGEGVVITNLDTQADFENPLCYSSGATGASGELGNCITPPVGDTGPQGDQGPRGDEGPQGVAGPAGADGAQGAAGPQGADASSGPQGANGPPGPQGSAGPQGAIGMDGPQGSAGPQGAIGMDGPQGSAGPQGAVGMDGPQGSAGPQGSDGSSGPQGDNGAPGPQGSAGPQGADGSSGPQGANGASGPQGAAGPQGAIGMDGPQGSAGPQGFAGPQGPMGIQENQGPQGASAASNCPVSLPTVSITACGSQSGAGAAFCTYNITSALPISMTGLLLTAGAPGLQYAVGLNQTASQTVSFNTGMENFQFTAVGFATTPCGTEFSPPVNGISGVCLAAGTLVTLSDGSSKPIEDITYEDQIRVWDFDQGALSQSKPLWIKRSETVTQFNLLTFSDGSTLRTINQHRIFNKEAGAFTYPMTDATPVGTTTFNVDGDEITLVAKEVMVAEVDYYNVITDHHLNLFADSILTSCRFNNVYPIAAMKFVKGQRALRDCDEFSGIPQRFVSGLRLREQTMEVGEMNWYVKRLLRLEAKFADVGKEIAASGKQGA